MSDYISLEHIIRDAGTDLYEISSQGLGTDARRRVVGVAGPVPDAKCGTEERRKVELVGRPTDKEAAVPAPVSSNLARLSAIIHNVIDEEERPTDDVQVAIGKIKGNEGNKVNLKPVTDDRNNDNQQQDSNSRRARAAANKQIGQAGAAVSEEALGEVFDSPYQQDTDPKLKNVRGVTSRKFSTGNGNRYTATVINRPGDRSASVTFNHEKHEGYQPSKAIEPHSAHRVIGTVKDVINQHLKSNPDVKRLHFSANMNEPGKVKLYHHLAKSVDKNYGHSVDNKAGFTDFRVRRPDNTHTEEFVNEISTDKLKNYRRGAIKYMDKNMGDLNTPGTKTNDRYNHYERALAKLSPGNGHLYGGEPRVSNSEHEKKKRDNEKQWEEEFVAETKSEASKHASPLQKAYQKLNQKAVGQASGLTKLTQKTGKLGVREEEEVLDEANFASMIDKELSREKGNTLSKVKAREHKTHIEAGKRVKSIFGKRRMTTKSQYVKKTDAEKEAARAEKASAREIERRVRLDTSSRERDPSRRPNSDREAGEHAYKSAKAAGASDEHASKLAKHHLNLYNDRTVHDRARKANDAALKASSKPGAADVKTIAKNAARQAYFGAKEAGASHGDAKKIAKNHHFFYATRTDEKGKTAPEHPASASAERIVKQGEIQKNKIVRAALKGSRKIGKSAVKTRASSPSVPVGSAASPEHVAKYKSTAPSGPPPNMSSADVVKKAAAEASMKRVAARKKNNGQANTTAV